jgi:formylglycine-generating enzyme required for sulfatase activity
MNKKNLLSALVFLVVAHSTHALASAPLCADVFISSGKKLELISSSSRITGAELSEQASLKIAAIPEFAYIREQAEKRGMRVWLFGGTASSYLHYAKWDLARQKGIKNLQVDRFDFDFTNIFRSTQDLDMVIDATEQQAREFQNTISAKYPHFLGSKAAKWEVRTLHTRMGNPGQPGFKEALLGDVDFSNQNSDSNSLGMVELTRSQDPIVRDLRHWDTAISPFLQDTLSDQISFFRSDKHFTTTRAKMGENPEILSVVRLLVKAFQYELSFSDADFAQMKSIVAQFDASQLQNSNAMRRFQDTAKKLVMHATNIEYALNKLDELGLRKKIIALGNKDEINSASWWLNKEPLRSKPVGEGVGKTAKELDIQVVAHETNSFLAYESITRSHSGEPNVLISRQNAAGEAAAFGNGFYTRIGKQGARGTGLTIRFNVNPQAREGVDFTHHGDYVVFQNKKALQVIQESLNFGLDDLMKMAESNQNIEVDQSDLALLEKLKRKLNAAKISDELNKLLDSKSKVDNDKLIQILSAFQNSSVNKLISAETLSSVVKNVYARIEFLSQSNQEADQMRYIQTVGPIAQTLEKQGLLKVAVFAKHLDQFIVNPHASFELRKLSAFEEILMSDSGLHSKKYFTENEWNQITHEIKTQWQKDTDARKRKYFISLDQKWSNAIEKADSQKLEDLAESGFFDVNHKSISGYSTLLRAEYYGQRKVIDWLIQNPEFDFNAKNEQGLSQVEQLRLAGKLDLAKEIEEKRPESKSREFDIRERNKDGSPIISFVKVKPGRFMMGDGEQKVQVTLTKPFEMLSTQTTQKMYKTVVHLLAQKYQGQYQLSPDPSGFKGDDRPVETVSFNDIQAWNDGLNKLSQSDDEKVQSELAQIFPGHHKGDTYRLPTEAEREYIQRNQGLAEGNYSFGNADKDLSDSAWLNTNAGNQTHPVGTKKPIFVNGRPIYDIQGNVWEWTNDWYDQKLPGGTDPQGPSSGSYRVLRGGGWGNDARYLRSGGRSGNDPSYRYNIVGFRLVRAGQ